RLEQVSIGVGLGVGCLTTVLYWIGLAGGLWLPVFVLLTLVGVGLAARFLLLLSRRPATPPLSPQQRWSRAAVLVIALSVLCVVGNLIGALAPPSFSDALIYHLYVPKQFLLEHRVVELSGIWQHYQSMAVEMLYMMALAFGSPRGASVVCAGLGILTAVGTFLIGSRLAGPLVGILAAAIFYDNAMTAWESTSCFVDLGTAALGTLGFYALLVWDQDRRRAWLIVGGLLLGFAASCKLNAASLAMVGAVLAAYFSWRSGEGMRVALARFVGIGVLAALPVVASLVRAWILTGNPVYPFATALFGANPDRADLDWVFANYGVGYSLWNRLLAPWHLFSHGAAFENGQYLSPLPVLMAPVIAFRAYHERKGRAAILGVVIGLLVIWAAGAHVARYAIPIEPLLAVLAADALCWLASFGGRRRVIVVVTAGTFLLVGTLGTLVYDRQFAAVTFGRESEDAFLRRNTWFYDALREACASLPPGGRILTNAQRSTFYLDCPQGRANDSDFEDPARLRAAVAKGGYTEILILGSEPLEKILSTRAPYVEPVWQREADIAVSRTLNRMAKGSAALYRIVQ
ncbi:MAG TPA: hypothetical protein VNO55_06610, partial [Polyangia bacterium]|nr:hypothetical protein [Polyangia bacterium]